jgi:cytochrome c biogenesis protein CcmG/thiol:disulfide interchange protein DsbE
VKDKVTPVVLGLVALALWAALEAPLPYVESPKPSEEVPNFTFTLNEASRQLTDLRGQVVVLNFWASWCPPCVAEMPSLERLNQRFQGKGLMVLGISVDQDADAYVTFLRDQNITFPNYRDPEKQISTLYGTFMYPETYIIDTQGRLVRKIIGPLEWDSPQVVEFLNGILEGPPRSAG